MSKGPDDEAKKEKLDLAGLMEHKVFRDFVRSNILIPCDVFTSFSLTDIGLANQFLGRQKIGLDILQNIKDANLEGYFQMEREITRCGCATRDC